MLVRHCTIATDYTCTLLYLILINRVTQLRNDGVPAGTGPVVLNAVPVTGAAILQVTMDQFNKSKRAKIRQNKTKRNARKRQSKAPGV